MFETERERMRARARARGKERKRRKEREQVQANGMCAQAQLLHEMLFLENVTRLVCVAHRCV